METLRHVGSMSCVSVLFIQSDPYLSISSIPFHQPQLTYTTRLTLPRPAPNKHKQHPYVRRVITVPLDILCPNLVLLMCIHAYAQRVRALIDDKGMHPDDQKDWVRILLLRVRVSIIPFAPFYFISPAIFNQHNPPYSSPPGSKYTQAEPMCPCARLYCVHI